jgi:serine/threonine protein kinase
MTSCSVALLLPTGHVQERPPACFAAPVLTPLEEFLATERSYIEDLRAMIQLCKALRVLKSVGADTCTAIFLNVCDIFECNSSLLAAARRPDDAGPASMRLATAFVSHSSEMMRLYGRYAVNHRTASKMLDQCSSTNKQFSAIVSAFVTTLGCCSLSGMLIKPVQRVCKYPLLLQQILTGLPVHSVILGLALEQAEMVCLAVDDKLSDAALLPSPKKLGTPAPQLAVPIPHLSPRSLSIDAWLVENSHTMRGSVENSISCKAFKCDTPTSQGHPKRSELLLFSDKVVLLHSPTGKPLSHFLTIALSDLVFMGAPLSSDALLLHDSGWDQWIRVQFPDAAIKEAWLCELTQATVLQSPVGASTVRLATALRSSSSSSLRSSCGIDPDQMACSSRKIIKLATDIASREEAIRGLEIAEQLLKTSISDMETLVSNSSPSLKGKRLDSKIKLDPRRVELHEPLTALGCVGSVVYSCMVDGWNCVCKQLQIDPSSAPDVSDFENEIKIFEALPAHRNLVQYFFHDRQTSVLRIFMKRYHCNLRHQIDTAQLKHGHWALSMLVNLSAQVANGLAFLHKNSIIHRDLKAENVFVMLDSRNEIHSLAIGDFDVSVQAQAAKTVIGTPGWIAPEVYLASGRYSTAADVYSYGMVLFELMTLRVPFAEHKRMAIPELVQKGVEPAFGVNLPPAYLPVILLHQRCIDPTDSTRPTAAKLKDMLTSIPVTSSN